MCGVCMFHDWCKTKSHAGGKPRLLQATCKIPNRTICATCPGTDPPPMISSWVCWLKATQSPRARQGFSVLSSVALSSWRWLPLGKGVNNVSADALRCLCLQFSCLFYNFLARSKASSMVEASFGVTSSIKQCFGIILGSSVLSGFSMIKARLKAFIASVHVNFDCSFFLKA